MTDDHNYQFNLAIFQIVITTMITLGSILIAIGLYLQNLSFALDVFNLPITDVNASNIFHEQSNKFLNQGTMAMYSGIGTILLAIIMTMVIWYKKIKHDS